MLTVSLIAFFGAMGCLARYYLSGWVYQSLGVSFPYGTLAVNITGAFFIGLLMELSMRSSVMSTELRVGLTVGFMGGLTTFSTFSYETFKLIEQSQFVSALTNILANVIFSLLFTLAGILAARQY